MPRKAKKVFSLDLILAVAGVVFVIIFSVLLWRYSTLLGYLCFSIFAAVFLLASILDYKQQKDRSKSESYLASLECPSCSMPFGLTAADEAFHRIPPIDEQFIIDDDFGYSVIVCDNCRAEYYYHRQSRELEMF